MLESHTQATKAARQLVETGRFLGVEFIPIRKHEAVISAAENLPVEDLEDLVVVRNQTMEELKAEHDAQCPHCTTATGIRSATPCSTSRPCAASRIFATTLSCTTSIPDPKNPR